MLFPEEPRSKHRAEFLRGFLFAMAGIGILLIACSIVMAFW
jgi:hypothetical protein